MTKNYSKIKSTEQDRLEALFKYNILDTCPEEEFDNITRLVAHVCETPIALISLIDENRQWVKSAFGFEPQEIPRQVSFCNHAISEVELFEIQDTTKNPIFNENPFVTKAPKIRYYAGHPLTTPEGHNIGTLCVVDKEPKKLSEDQKLALATLATHVMSILELRYKNQKLEERIEDLTAKALEKITLELESYKIALDETSGVLISDTKGKILFVNDETCRMSKYTREELIGKDSTIFDSDFHNTQFFSTLWATIASGKIWKNEIKNISKDGTYYWTDTTIVPFLDESNSPKKFVSIKKDITKQKQGEQRINQFFSLSTDFFCVAKTNGYFEKISPAFSKELGFDEEELFSKPFFEFVHPDDVERTKQELEKLSNGANTINFKIRFRCKDNSFRLLSWNATPDKESGVLYATARDITESSRIHDENRKLSLVAKGTNNIVIITDKQRNIEWVNHAFEELTGYQLEEVVGKNPGSILQFGNTQKETILAIRKALNNMETFNGEIENVSKSGRKYWIELNISPIFNDNGELLNFIAIESDITEKKKKDININNLIQTQNSIFNGVGHAVMFTGANGLIQRINQAGLNLLGYTENEVVGKKGQIDFHDFGEIVARSMELSQELNTPVVPGFETLIAKARNQQNMDANEWTYISKEGKRIPVWLSVTSIKNSDGTLIGYFSAAEDYTVKKQIEQSLIEAKNFAEQAAHAKDSFLANMSHEIRTPLNAIIGFTELLSQNSLDPIQKDYVNNINTAGANLLLIINDILDISKIESGQLVLEANPVDLKSTLKHVYNLLKVKADEKNIEFNLLLDADMPEYVLGDKGRLNQILMNLAGNSLKFTEEGEVTISVKKLAETSDKVRLRFSIRDTGIGIPEDKTTTIFERFTQAEATTTRRFGGTGLGLNIVKQLVELQNGEINVKSKVGQGSDFYFTIEFQKVEKEVELDEPSIENKIEEPLGNLAILLCEDNELNQHLAKKVIEKFGFKLDIANNGKEGIDMLISKNYDLILMDLQMSVMDGYQTTIYIREILKSNIPIIAMTAHSLVGERQKCKDIGMNDYVSKPFKQNELLEKIRNVSALRNEDLANVSVNTMSYSSDNLKNEPTASTIEESTFNKLQREIDFSYIDELSGGDEEFKKEIIKLFIQSMPDELEALETAIINNQYTAVMEISHQMKSTLSMFNLLTEVAYWSELELNAKAAIIKENEIQRFDVHKKSLAEVILILQNIING